MLYIDSHCSLEQTYDGEHYYHFTGPCIKTSEPYTVHIKGHELFALRNTDAPIQVALAALGADDREFVLSGLSPEGWKLLFEEGGDE